MISRVTSLTLLKLHPDIWMFRKIDNICFYNMVSQITLQSFNFIKPIPLILKPHFWIYNDIVSNKIYDKCDDFHFEIVRDGGVLCFTSFIFLNSSDLLEHLAMLQTSALLTEKPLKQGYQYHKLHVTFSKFYHCYYDLISKFRVILKSFLRQGLWEPEFYVDLVYSIKENLWQRFFSTV